MVLGQFSFLATITTLIIAARLRKFDIALEEAALNLGASRRRGCSLTITLPFLAPAMIAAFLVGFLVSFENFNTTLMLVGSDAPLTITMYDRMVKVGATPVLNAVSVFLMLGSGLLALVSILVQRPREGGLMRRIHQPDRGVRARSFGRGAGICTPSRSSTSTSSTPPPSWRRGCARSGSTRSTRGSRRPGSSR